MDEADLLMAEECLNRYSLMLNDKARRGDNDHAKTQRLFIKLDQWFAVLDSGWANLKSVQ